MARLRYRELLLNRAESVWRNSGRTLTARAPILQQSQFRSEFRVIRSRGCIALVGLRIHKCMAESAMPRRNRNRSQIPSSAHPASVVLKSKATLRQLPPLRSTALRSGPAPPQTHSTSSPVAGAGKESCEGRT